MTAPAVAAVGTVAAISGTTVSPGVPSGVVSGSLVVASLSLFWGETSTAPTSAAVTAPTGFTFGGIVAYVDTPDSGYVAVFWYYKYATGSDTGTYVFTGNTVGSHGVADGRAVAMRVTGGPTSGNSFVDTFESASSSANVTTLSVSTFTPTAGNTLLLGAFSITDTESSVTGPTGWTQSAFLGTSGYSFGVSSLQQTTAAATGSVTWSWSTGGTGAALIASIRTPPGGFTGTLGTSASGTVSFAGVPHFGATLAVSGSGTASDAASPAIAGSVATSATGSAVSAGAPSMPGSLATSAVGAMAPSGSPHIAAAIAFSASGTAVLVGSLGFPGSISLSASGAATLAASPHVNGSQAVSASGSAVFAAVPHVTASQATSGSGALALQAVPSVQDALELAALGTVGLVGVPSMAALLALSASGVLQLAGHPVFPSTAKPYMASTALRGADGITGPAGDSSGSTAVPGADYAPIVSTNYSAEVSL